jgi:ribosomal protein L12E/L44/L45/RPP1/RPP2
MAFSGWSLASVEEVLKGEEPKEDDDGEAEKEEEEEDDEEEEEQWRTSLRK